MKRAAQSFFDLAALVSSSFLIGVILLWTHNGKAPIDIPGTRGKYALLVSHSEVKLQFREPTRVWGYWRTELFKLAAAFAILPVAWLARFPLRGRKILPGNCQGCGYDLRATPERCPECGAIPSMAKGAAT